QAWIDTVKRMGGRRALADSVSGNLGAAQALTGAICMARRMRHGRGGGAESSTSGSGASDSRANAATMNARGERTVGLLLPTTAGGALANMAALLAGKTLVNLNYTASDEALA